jgi:hypothetical protein
MDLYLGQAQQLLLANSLVPHPIEQPQFIVFSEELHYSSHTSVSSEEYDTVECSLSELYFWSLS